MRITEGASKLFSLVAQAKDDRKSAGTEAGSAASVSKRTLAAAASRSLTPKLAMQRPMTPGEQLHNMEREQVRLLGAVTHNAEASFGKDAPKTDKYKKIARDLQAKFEQAADKGDLEACQKIHEQLVTLAKKLNQEYYEQSGSFWGDMPRPDK